ncbi:MAG TPA: ATP-binding protein [Burkholderiales bacterium]|nr:ATP-binding protein [Burkholderiales bacterium]
MHTVTLDTCDREPIHIPGSIQGHGVLLACSGAGLTIVQASANLGGHLGMEADAALGRPLAALLDADSGARIAGAAREQELRAVNPVLVVASADGKAFDAVLHRPPNTSDTLVVELEPREPSRAGSAGLMPFDPRLRAAMLRLQSAKTVDDLCRIAVEQVRAITGFDRVTIYRFDADWNGEVVAETRRSDLEPFLGLHYPSSDIPAQARRLYTLNWLRHIADVDYVPSPLVPQDHPPTGEPLDLSYAVLRSVSPIHIQYLKNMGVTASMSISLLLDGELTGLIACHHYSGPWRLGFQVRETAEYLGQALSWHLDALETADRAERARRIQETEARLIERMAAGSELLDALAGPELQSLVDAAGAAVVLREGTRRLGSTPKTEDIAALVGWLRQTDQDVFATEKLQDHFPRARHWDDCAAGLVAVAISRELGEYLLWFRPSTERTVDWAGDPRKNVETADDGTPSRLTPRGSFALWRETVRGSALPWHPLHVQAASTLRRVLLGGVRRRAAELRDINDRLTAADRQKDAFIATVSHELRTPLNAISGWAHLLQSGLIGPDRTAQALEVISRNVKSQTELIEDLLDISRMASGKLSVSIEHVDLVPLVERVLEEVALSVEAKGLKLKRILDSEAPVLGDADRLRQVVSNLLTNAVKFTPKGGSISVVVQRQRSDVEISVTDTGQGIAADFLPHVFEAFRQAESSMSRRTSGLGLGLAITRKLVELHGGRIEAESEGEGRGAAFRVRLPIAPASGRALETDVARASDIGCPPQLEALHVLIVEDDNDSRELLRTILGECGAIVEAVRDAHAALDALAQRRFDLMISDIGLPGVDGLELMRKVRALNGGEPRMPAIALTAYTRAVDRTRALQAGFQAHVPKPVDPQELITVAASVAGRLS